MGWSAEGGVRRFPPARPRTYSWGVPPRPPLDGCAPLHSLLAPTLRLRQRAVDVLRAGSLSLWERAGVREAMFDFE